MCKFASRLNPQKFIFNRRSTTVRLVWLKVRWGDLMNISPSLREGSSCRFLNRIGYGIWIQKSFLVFLGPPPLNLLRLTSVLQRTQQTESGEFWRRFQETHDHVKQLDRW